MPEIVIVDKNGVEHVFPDGFDPQRAAAIVRGQFGPAPIDANEPDTYLGGALKGLKEGAMGGIRGFGRGLLPGAWEGVTNLLKLPSKPEMSVKTPQELALTAPKLSEQPAASIERVASDVDAAAGDIARNPEAFGEQAGRATGQTLTGIAASRAVPLAVKPAARTIGRGLQYVSEHPMGSHLTGGGAIVAGIMKGSPEAVAAGTAAQALPYAAGKLGEKLRIFGGETPSVVRIGSPSKYAKAVGKLEDQFDHAMAKRNVAFADEQAAAAENAARREAIEQAKEGMVPSQPRISERVSAKTPGGGNVSASQTFSRPPEEVDLDAPHLDTSVPVKAGDLTREQLAERVTHGTPKGVRLPMGKAAQDIAEGKVPPQAPVGPQSTLDDLAKKIGTGVDEEKAVQDLQLQTENASRLAHRNTRVPIDEVPASKSRRSPMSATEGLTVEDVRALGLNPDLPIKELSPEAKAYLLKQRAARGAGYREDARAAKALAEAEGTDAPSTLPSYMQAFIDILKNREP